MYRYVALMVCVFSIYNPVMASEFAGDLKLLPVGCQQTDARTCRLGSLLTFKSSDGLVWQTDVWKDGNGQSGTTDGASIPKWAQPVIGDAYDESFLKAAIVHDHYCYKENHVRSWRQTHRMFYDALIDLGISKIKAKTMYFAVYGFGPRWIDLVPGENCGANCIKTVTPSGEVSEPDQFASSKTQAEIEKFELLIEKNPNMSVGEIEVYARSLKPNDFYFNNGSTYVPKSANDPNIFAKY